MADTKLRLSKAKIRNAKKHLRKLQRERGLSLRQMAAILNNQISFQSLGRFIGEKDYVPKDESVCRMLDLYADQNPYRGMPRWYKRIPEALQYWNSTKARIKYMFLEAKNQSQQMREAK